MELSKHYILLLKEKKSEDEYEKALKAHCMDYIFIPVLSFQYSNSEKFKDVLRKPGDYNCVIFTSQRAVEALNRIITSEFQHEWTDLEKEWIKKPCYVVGKVTSEAAQLLGFQTKGNESGSAEKLVPVILSEVEASGKSALFPCGNLKRETIPDQLQQHSIALTSIVVYETVPNVDFDSRVSQCIHNKGIPEFLAFFSPSGVNFSHTFLKQRNVLAQSKVIAIGTSTEEALRKKSVVVSGTCDKPTPESLMQTITCILQQT